MTNSLKQNIVFSVALLVLSLIFAYPASGDHPGLIRLHVIANSDSKYDQALKLKVRDAVLAVSEDLPPDTIRYNLHRLEKAAIPVLRSNGCSLPVDVQFGKFDFPTRTYGNVTLPAGKYTAVRVVIGEGVGKNWWCVMYPPLCFTDRTTAHFDKDFITKSGPTQSGRPQFKIKFKLAEIFS